MNSKIIKDFIVIIFFLSAVQIIGQPKIYIVRHSEKIEDWKKGYTDFQPLNEEGVETSKKLAEYFKDINLSVVYSSGLTRTLQTAYFVSKSQSLEIEVEEACNDTSLINSFLENLNENFDKDESVLIISHSNIIPYFLIKLGLKESDYKRMDFTKSNTWFVTDYYGEVFIIERNENSNKIYREKF